MAPTPGQLHIDRYLTNLSIEFQQAAENFIAPQVFPIVEVDKQSDKYVKFDRDSFWRDNFPERPLGGAADVDTYTISDDTYFCVERALAHKYDDRQAANADEPIELARMAVQLLTTRAMVNMDRRFVSKYFTDDVWATELEGKTSSPSTGEFLKFTESGSDPMRVIDDAKTAIHSTTALMPNRMIVSEDVHRVVRNHPAILDRIKYTQRGTLSNDLLASLFEVDRYIVARSIYNDAKEGADADLKYIAPGGKILLTYAAPAPGLYQPSAGYVFSWRGLLGDQTSPMGTVVQRGRDDMAHSDHYEIRVANDMKVVSDELGAYLKDVI